MTKEEMRELYSRLGAAAEDTTERVMGNGFTGLSRDTVYDLGQVVGTILRARANLAKDIEKEEPKP